MAESFISCFELIGDTKLNDYIPVKKYKSSNTGLTVIFGEIEGPIVSGQFFIVTEPSDNDGLPHTLEHLISLGSEDYPYKGVLDFVANRCLASGVDAWTSDDHVFYNIECVGAEELLRTLPVYMDHILYPLLTDTAFVTEVHHITEEGKDGGEVYCEMQGLENTEEGRINFELMKELYHGTGYAVHCGGLMKNLRKSTTNEKIKEFHKKFYRPENLTLIIAGQVDPNDVFDALIPIEKKILSKGELPPFERPWQNPIDPITDSKTITITYPYDEESIGIAAIAYRGPSTHTDQFHVKACDIMLGYLSDFITSPLMRDMVEIDDKYASFIYSCATTYQDCLLRFVFRNAPLKNIDGIYDKYFSVLKKIGNGEEPIDMGHMRAVIDQKITGNLFDLEVLPHTLFPNDIMRHVVYGDDDNFDEWLNSNKIFSELLNNDESFWTELLQKYFIDAKHVYVKAIPSIEEEERLVKKDQERFNKRKQDLGPEGLLEMAKILKEATEANNVPCPGSLIETIPVPTYKNIGTYPIKIHRLTDEHDLTMLHLERFPVYTEAIDINSNLAYVILSINTENIPERLRLYLRLFLELLGKCPVLRDGKEVPYDKVYETDLIYKTIEIGIDDSPYFFCGSYSTTVFIDLRFGLKKFHLAAEWLEDILNHTIFNADRVTVFAHRILNDTAEIKKSGFSIVIAMVQAMLYKSISNVRLTSVLKQEKFLKDLLEQLDDPTEAQGVIDDLNTLRTMLMQGPNLGLHIATNWKEIPSNEIDPVKPFQMSVETNDEIKELQIVSDHQLIDLGGNEETHGLILQLEAVDSAYLYSAVLTIDNYLDPDLPALMLLCQYFIKNEGPFYHDIHEKGYADGYLMEVTSENGLLTFNLNCSKNLPVAYQTAKTLVENLLEENAAWDPKLLQSAKVALIRKICEREESLVKAVKQAVFSSFKKVPVDYNTTLIKQVNEVIEEDLARVGEKYMKLLFGAEARTAIVCHPDKAKEIQTGFEELGYLFKIEASIENSILA